MMKSTAKKVLCYLAALLLSGATGQFAYAQSSLYWTETKGRKISRAALQGNLEEDVRISPYHTPSHIAVDQAGGKMYWTGVAQPPNRGAVSFGSIRSADLDGSNEVLLLGAVSGSILKRPVDIALDVAGGKMYWTEGGWPKIGIYRANLDGSFPEQLIDLIALRKNYGTGQGQSLEFGQAWGLALDLQNGRLCWTDYFAADIHCSDLNGGGIQRVVPASPGARGIDIDPVDGRIYWVTGNSGDVMRVNADGSNPEVILNGRFGTKLNYPMDIVTDSRHLYFTDNNDGIIYRSNLDGSGVVVLHTLQFERKPGKYKNLEPMGIALSLAPSASVPTELAPASPAAPAPALPSPSTALPAAPPAPPAPLASAPATAPAPTAATATPPPAVPPVAPRPAAAPATVKAFARAMRPDVTYKSKRGRWDIFVPASPDGSPTTYSVVLYDLDNPQNRLTLLSNQSTRFAAFIKVKGLSLASQGLPENGSYVAITVTSAGKASAPGPVRIR